MRLLTGFDSLRLCLVIGVSMRNCLESVSLFDLLDVEREFFAVKCWVEDAEVELVDVVLVVTFGREVVTW